jgi:hypothetical protein
MRCSAAARLARFHLRPLARLALLLHGRDLCDPGAGLIGEDAGSLVGDVAQRDPTRDSPMRQKPRLNRAGFD